MLHVALDVLDDHDRVVHHDADREHHAEQRQEVDREAEDQHSRERADERDHDRDRADQGRAQALQEQVDDGDHEHQRFEQRVDDLVDRDAHEVVGVERDLVLDAGRKRGLELLHRLANRRRDLQPVRAGLLVDDDRGARRGVQLVVVDVLPAADRHARHVSQAHDRAPVGSRAQDDALVERRIGERRLRDQRDGQLLLPGVRLRVHLSGADERVLGGDRVLDVARGDVE
jgi:hypothetical protein